MNKAQHKRIAELEATIAWLRHDNAKKQDLIERRHRQLCGNKTDRRVLADEAKDLQS